MGSIRSPWLWVTALLLMASVGGAGFWSYREEKRSLVELAQARNDLEAGRVVSARARLNALTSRRPGYGEAWYLLGLCEKSRQRLDDAVKAWERVPAGSPFAVKAAVERGRILIDSGGFSEAETLLEAQPQGAGTEAKQVRGLLELLYRFEGRTDDLRREILKGWGVEPDPGLVLRQSYGVDISTYPAELVGKIFASAPPDDDRVWLGRAHLARDQGRLDEAAKLLKDCRKRRPDDAAVWRETLAVAQAAGDAAGAWEATEHLPASAFSGAERARLRVWFASKPRDPHAERLALESLVAEQPGDTAAWDHLAELSLAAGKADEAQGFRKRKAEINAIRTRYKKLIDRPDRAAIAGELAQLAESLGRKVEERGWRLIARNGADSVPPLEVGAEPARSSIAPHVDFADTTLAGALFDIRPKSASAGGVATGGSATVPQFADDVERAGLGFIYDNGLPPAGRRPPRRCAGAWGCSTTTAMDGSMSMPCREALSRRAGPPRRTVIVCSEIGGTGRSKMSPRVPGSPRSREDTGTGSRSATMTTTASPTFSSPDGAATPSIATRGTGRSKTRPVAPACRAIGIGRPRRPSPTSTPTATSTSMSAIISDTTRSTRSPAGARTIPRATSAIRSTSRRSPTMPSGTTGASSST